MTALAAWHNQTLSLRPSPRQYKNCDKHFAIKNLRLGWQSRKLVGPSVSKFSQFPFCHRGAPAVPLASGRHAPQLLSRDQPHSAFERGGRGGIVGTGPSAGRAEKQGTGGGHPPFRFGRTLTHDPRVDRRSHYIASSRPLRGVTVPRCALGIDLAGTLVGSTGGETSHLPFDRRV